MYIPTTDLTPGQHLLTIRMKTLKKGHLQETEHYIPFWLQVGKPYVSEMIDNG